MAAPEGKTTSQKTASKAAPSDGTKKKELEKEEEDDGKWGISNRMSVTYKKRYGTVTFREFAAASGVKEGAILIDGMPGSTLTSVLTAGYLCDELKLPIIACVTSRNMPPKVVIEDSQPLQLIRFCGAGNVVVIQSEVGVTGTLAHDVIACVLDFAARKKVKMVMAIEGLPMELVELPKELFRGSSPYGDDMPGLVDDKPDKRKDKPEDKKSIRFNTTSAELAATLKKASCIPIRSGIISGSSGALIGAGLLQDFNVKGGNEEETNSTSEGCTAPAPAAFSWPDFLRDAGIPESFHATYNELLTAEGIDESLAGDLNGEWLKSVGITSVGHQMRIVKQAKSLCAKPEEAKYDLTLLLAPCDARFPDARAAVAIVRLISQTIIPEANISVAKLEEKAQELAKKVNQAISSSVSARSERRLSLPSMYA